ncbi:MAG: histidine ammonia-lyase [Gemmatimonadales bacterium]|nr:MAG: histidine ammonia-lyase [Gemmatimonadales bacterium]
MSEVVLDGHSLTVEDVVAVARNGARVSVAAEARERALRAREIVEKAAAGAEAVYGINTGFGKLAHVRIAPDQLRQLQRNLILSHCAGVGAPLPVPIVRAIMLLRANVLLKETSGVRPLLAERLADLLNAGIHPVVPEQGSVGASGDLAPLSHVALALMGEGEVEFKSRRVGARAALEEAGMSPVEYEVKEGLAFINGTQAQTAILALLVHDSENLWRSAHGAAAMSLEALRGTPVPFDERIHRVRPHPGQLASAALMRELLADSEIRESHRVGDPRVQDAYSLRCIPQVLGSVRDAIDFARRTLEIELNAATDNPLVFGEELLSGGNFHGQPVALALDLLTIALTTLAGIAERRIEALLNPDLSQGLPAFLTPHAGLQSGFMMIQVMAASLVAECRTLCAPASVQSIPTDANQEDVVPMGMAAAVKARRVLANAQRVVAAELICGAQGLEFLKPLKPGRGVQQVYERVRRLVSPLIEDRPLTDDVERVAQQLAVEAIV